MVAPNLAAEDVRGLDGLGCIRLADGLSNCADAHHNNNRDYSQLQ
jgi:hypothetical protein